jgi:hypothetical protein
VLYPFESTKNSIIIVLEIGVWQSLTYTCIFFNVLKCILKHAIIQYFLIKSKIFLLLIIKVKNIHEFNVLSLSVWIFPLKKIKSFIGILYHAFSPNAFKCQKNMFFHLRKPHGKWFLNNFSRISFKAKINKNHTLHQNLSWHLYLVE